MNQSSRLRRFATAGSLAVTALFSATMVACSPTDALEVETPDIINPADVRSAAGADAVRTGTLARFNSATTGSESLFLLGGLFTDEWINGDSFIARQEIDQRVITVQNNFLTDANRVMHRARLSAAQAIDLMKEFRPTAPGWQVAEMFFVEAYIENLMAEHYCNGLVFSTVVNGGEVYGSPITDDAAFAMALAHADSGLALITGTTANDVKIRSALQVTKGRILMNLNRYADAAAAVASVATSFKYDMLHSQTTNSNGVWSMNNLAWRYSVGNGEGTNGLNFATANDPRVPVCIGGDATCRTNGVTRTTKDDQSTPLHVQLVWPLRESPMTVAGGVEARLIEAEVQLRANNASVSLASLNGLRATVTGLTPLLDAGTETARVNQLFRERAFWLFGRGHRVGALRRLVRQYSRTVNSVFPVGAWHKGGNYGSDVTIPVPLAEENNPNVPSGQTCLDRNP